MATANASNNSLVQKLYGHQTVANSAPWQQSQTITYSGSTISSTDYDSYWHFTEVPCVLSPYNSQEPNVVITGKQFVVVCNGRVEYADTLDLAQSAAEKLAHANQVDAFILKPVSKTAPKRDVVTTAIKL